MRRGRLSAQALRRLRPLERRRLRTERPAFVAIRLRKPWSRLRLRLLGWNVLFTVCCPSSGLLGRRSARGPHRALRCVGAPLPWGCSDLVEPAYIRVPASPRQPTPTVQNLTNRVGSLRNSPGGGGSRTRADRKFFPEKSLSGDESGVAKKRLVGHWAACYRLAALRWITALRQRR